MKERLLTIRVQHRQRFTVVDSRTVNDDQLSMRARGILVWLLDKPDGWRVSADAIARACTEGRDAVRSALRELERHGYLERSRFQDPESGRWVTDTVVREVPDEHRRRVSSRRESSGREPDGGNPAADVTTHTHDDDPMDSPPPADDTRQANVAALEQLPAGVDPEAVKRLCKVLRDEIGQHHPRRGKPTVQPTWVREFGRLLHSGPAGWEGNPPTADEVELMIGHVFLLMADRNHRGFCWADQIRSPESLRRNWLALEQQLATTRADGGSTGPTLRVVGDGHTGAVTRRDFDKKSANPDCSDCEGIGWVHETHPDLKVAAAVHRCRCVNDQPLARDKSGT